MRGDFLTSSAETHGFPIGQAIACATTGLLPDDVRV